MKIFSDERGFVLIEFVIALPLLMLLLYAIGTMSFKLMEISQKQAADYILEREVQDILERITTDARAAISVDINKIHSPTGYDLEEIAFVCHSTKNNLLGNNTSTATSLEDLLEDRLYTIDIAKDGYYHIHSRRISDNKNSNPITGGNFFGDTEIVKLNFSKRDTNILHIILEIRSVKTKQQLKINTSVYMPGLNNE